MYREKNEIGHKRDHNQRFAEKTYVRTHKPARQLQNEYQSKLNQKARMEKEALATENPGMERRFQADIRRLDRELRKLEAQMECLPRKRNRVKTHPRKKDMDRLEEQVLAIVEDVRRNPGIRFLTKEDVALELHARVSQIEQVFMCLNQKGILSQPEHRAMHDTSRDPYGFDISAWQSDHYYVLDKAE